MSVVVKRLARDAEEAPSDRLPAVLSDIDLRLAGPLAPDDRASLRAARALVLARQGERAPTEMAILIARRTLGVSPDAERHVAGLLARARTLLDGVAPPSPAPPPPAAPSPAPASPADLVCVELAGDRVRVADGPWVDLARRGPTRRILHALAHARRTDGRGLDVYALFAAGWPGEDPDPEAQANRVYVVLHALRGMGLRAALKTSDDGYRLLAHIVGG